VHVIALIPETPSIPRCVPRDQIVDALPIARNLDDTRLVVTVAEFAELGVDLKLALEKISFRLVGSN
jgi:hypothetical protein